MSTNEPLPSTGDEEYRALNKALQAAYERIETAREHIINQDDSPMTMLDAVRDIEKAVDEAYSNAGLMYGTMKALLDLAQRLVYDRAALATDAEAAYQYGWDARLWHLLSYLNELERLILLWRLEKRRGIEPPSEPPTT